MPFQSPSSQANRPGEEDRRGGIELRRAASVSKDRARARRHRGRTHNASRPPGLGVVIPKNPRCSRSMGEKVRSPSPSTRSTRSAFGAQTRQREVRASRSVIPALGISGSSIKGSPREAFGRTDSDALGSRQTRCRSPHRLGGPEAGGGVAELLGEAGLLVSGQRLDPGARAGRGRGRRPSRPRPPWPSRGRTTARSRPPAAPSRGGRPRRAVGSSRRWPRRRSGTSRSRRPRCRTPSRGRRRSAAPPSIEESETLASSSIAIEGASTEARADPPTLTVTVDGSDITPAGRRDHERELIGAPGRSATNERGRAVARLEGDLRAAGLDPSIADLSPGLAPDAVQDHLAADLGRLVVPRVGLQGQVGGVALGVLDLERERLGVDPRGVARRPGRSRASRHRSGR